MVVMDHVLQSTVQENVRIYILWTKIIKNKILIGKRSVNLQQMMINIVRCNLTIIKIIKSKQIPFEAIANKLSTFSFGFPKKYKYLRVSYFKEWMDWCLTSSEKYYMSFKTGTICGYIRTNLVIHNLPET